MTDIIIPNTIKSYKISQKLSPKHAAHGVAQSPYPICRHGKAYLSKQPPWRAAGDPRVARGRSRVRAPAPAGALSVLFFSTLPSFLLWEIGLGLRYHPSTETYMYFDKTCHCHFHNCLKDYQFLFWFFKNVPYSSTTDHMKQFIWHMPEQPYCACYMHWLLHKMCNELLPSEYYQALSEQSIN